MVDTMSLQDKTIPAVNLAQILIGVTLQENVTLQAHYCRIFFPDIVELVTDTKAVLSGAMLAASSLTQINATEVVFPLLAL